MVLGNDFGCLSNSDPRSPGFVQCLDRGFEDPPTWGIEETLRRAGLPGDRCFFTNAYLGLRTAIKTTGASPGVTNSEFQKTCQEFLERQLVMQRPSLIVCLGHEPRKLCRCYSTHKKPCVGQGQNLLSKPRSEVRSNCQSENQYSRQSPFSDDGVCRHPPDRAWSNRSVSKNLCRRDWSGCGGRVASGCMAAGPTALEDVEQGNTREEES